MSKTSTERSKTWTVRNRRILLVDDEANVRTSVSWLLDLDQHEVTQAASADEALELYAPGRFDLVITDMRMPGMSGADLAIRIKRQQPNQPIIMLTAYTEVSRSSENPVDDIVSKPPWLADLRQSIARALENSFSD